VLVFLFGCLAIVVRRPYPALSANPFSEKQASSLADQLVGTWRLVSIETVWPNGELIYPGYGKRPEGLLMYDRGVG
jgi:hypothetical protein